MNSHPLPRQIGRFVNIWWFSYIAWLVGFFVLGALAVVLPLLIGAQVIPKEEVKWFALAAATASGLQTFLRCESKAERYHSAYIILNSAKMRYECDGDDRILGVVGAWESGEQTIGAAFAPKRPLHSPRQTRAPGRPHDQSSES